MKISEVSVEKFRSIKQASFCMRNITAVVGENNVGKTAILRAINAVLNYKEEEENFNNKRHKHAARSNTHITISFIDVPDKQVYSDKLHNDKLTIKFTFEYKIGKRKLSIIKGKTKISIDDNFMKELTNDIMYIYIPAGRAHQNISWASDSIYRELLSRHAALQTYNRDNISSQVKKVTQKVDSTILSKLESQISSQYLQNKDADFKIRFRDNLDYSILLDKTELCMQDGESTHLLEDCGSGVKSLAIIAMYRANALLRNVDVVLGIEEPETNLHPQAQKRFIKSLRDDMHINEIQTIFTTHSTVLVDELKHEDILLVRRVHDTTREFVSSVSQIQPDFWAKYDIEYFKVHQYFYYRNSDFFFSKYVILGESKNDCQVFYELIRPEIEDRIADISFVEGGGAKSLKYPYLLLKELGIPFITIVDRDFFFPYKNQELSKSRNEKTGLPLYSNLLNKELVPDILHLKGVDEKKIAEAHMQGYRKFFSIMKMHRILPMNYCLEMDLTCSSMAREKYFNLLNIKNEDCCQKYLLINCLRSIKKIENLMEVLCSISRSDYPESYTKIKNAIVEDIKEKVKD